jgi:hypothetical protein
VYVIVRWGDVALFLFAVLGWVALTVFWLMVQVMPTFTTTALVSAPG